ncbi:MAG: hypothetical protein CL920_05740 [Deltaproteobacteria bacterium]|nr:hypothetical protein [Deltaproteobacteria bacterium]MBU48184.1 hypothetical protein [Deltaproteobacteria bacterium]|tara:strand:- start:22755 stop:25265 length:2511 start_codon:yes stop_codon:yes gene_type:complete
MTASSKSKSVSHPPQEDEAASDTQNPSSVRDLLSSDGGLFFDQPIPTEREESKRDLVENVDSKEAPVDLLTAGELVQHFKVQKRLGHGGMSQVYLAQDMRLARKVALKMIHPKHIGHWDMLTRFLQEARATARFNHPHIIQIYAVGEFQGAPYVVLEYLEGLNLRAYLFQRVLSFQEKLSFSVAICEALLEAHRHQVLHCDLKPENIIIPQDKRLRVLDFGLSRRLRSTTGREGKESLEAIELQELSTPLVTQIRGTPGYMAPEQWKEGGVLSTGTDVWALGVLLWELLTGEHPFKSETLLELRTRVCQEQPDVSLSSTGADVPPVLEELLLSCLQYDAAVRPSVEHILGVLRSFVSEEKDADASGAGPFVGLVPMSLEQSFLFTGRESLREDVLTELAESTFVSIVGAAGVGKSSFLQACLLPAVLEEGRWEPLSMRCGEHPLRDLVSTMRASFAEVESDDAVNSSFLSDIQSDPGLLRAAFDRLATCHEKEGVLFVLDAFEDIVSSPLEEQRLLIALFSSLQGSAHRCVLSVREDRLSECTQIEGVKAFFVRSLYLSAPTAHVLEMCLRHMLTQVGGVMSPLDFSSRLCRDIGENGHAFSFLQIVGQRLWENRTRELTLTYKSLEDVRGVAGLIVTHANEVLHRFSPTDKQLALRLLSRFVTGHAQRRWIAKENLFEQSDAEHLRVFERLVEERLVELRVRADGLTGLDASLSHPVLASEWSLLSSWTREHSVEHSLLQEIEWSMALWEQRGHLPGDLLRGKRLRDCLTWMGEQPPELTTQMIEYILLSEQDAAFRDVAPSQRRRPVRWSRWFAGLGWLFFLFSLLWTLVARSC